MSKTITTDTPPNVFAQNGRAATDVDRNFSYMSCVADALSSASTPMGLEQLVHQIEEMRPHADNVRGAVCRALERLYQAAPVADGSYGWLANLLDGGVIRHPLTTEEAARGFLMLDELEHAAFFPQFFQTHRPDDRVLYIELFGGPTIPAEAYIENKTWSLRLGDQFSDWVDMQGGQGRDDILIMVKDAAAGEYAVRLQPRESRIDADIQSRNVEVALLAEEIVRRDEDPNHAISAWDLAARLVAQKAFDHAIAPDDLHYVLHQYSVLQFESGLYMLKPGRNTDTEPTSTDLPAVQGPMDAADTFAGNVPMTPFDAFSEWEPTIGSSLVKGELDGHLGEQARNEMGNLSVSSIHDAYDSYLDFLYQAGLNEMPLTLDEYQLLRVELDGLMRIEEEFGYMLRVQHERKQRLLSQLHLSSSCDGDDDIDLADDLGLDDAPFWGI